MAKKTAKSPRKKAASGKQLRKQLKSVGKNVRQVRKNVSKEVKGVRKGFSKSLARSTKTISKQNAQIREELEKLREDMQKGKESKPKRELSMYNLFVRKQIQQGKTFEQAVKAWKGSKKILEKGPSKRKARPKKAKASKPKSARKKTKQSKRIKSLPLQDIMNEISSLKRDVNAFTPEETSMPKPRMSAQALASMEGLPNEEVAVRLTHLYFEEIARLGFKRRLDFDAIINAYYYCLQRLQNREKEMDVMRKLVAKEESKMMHETKAELFPGGEE